MANSKAPKHDFAPAWLKIPSSEGLKPSGPKSADHGDKSGRPRRDDYHGGFNRFGASEYMYGPMQRQRSFENYYDDRRYSPQKFRHHSGDDDPFSPSYGYNYGYNGYNYNDSYNNHYRSHPALFRDGKYQHPNSRFTQMNGGFPPHPPPPPAYYDPYFYEYYANDPYYNNYMRGMSGNGNGNGGPRKRYPSGDKDAKGQLKSDKDKEHKKQDGDHDVKKSDNLEEEFPSLNGDAESQDSKPNAKPVPSSGVWDKGPSAKLVNGKLPSSNGDSHSSHISDGQSKDSSNRQQNSNIYKTLVPKNPLTRKVNKEASKLMGTGKDLNSNHSGPNKLPPSSSTSPFKVVNNKDGNKEVTCPSPTSTMDILNTRLVTTPKNLTDKKSDFLKTLREDKSSGPKKFDLTAKDDLDIDDAHQQHSDEPESLLQNGSSQCHEELSTNGIHDLKLGRGLGSLLSSSVEAEQKLLKEMGWSETDCEEYEITEDEKREFEKRSKQLKEQRNGFKKTLPSPWSPQHLASFIPTLKRDEDSAASSLSEDSDLE